MDQTGTNKNGPPDKTAPPPTAEQVFLDHAPRVYNLARRMVGNDADAEDVTQDVLLQVVRKLDTFRGDANLTTWLHRVTVNAALAHRRKRANREHREVPDPLEMFTENGHHSQAVRPWSATPDRLAVKRETTELIEKAIRALPELYRDVYVLADVEGLPNQDIGDLLGLLRCLRSRKPAASGTFIDASRPRPPFRGGGAMMTCKELAEILMAYCDGELPAECCELICQHIRLCSPCHHYLESYQITMQHLPRSAAGRTCRNTWLTRCAAMKETGTGPCGG